MEWTNIHKIGLFFMKYLVFHFCFSFHFSDLSQNNLTGTIPTQIGLMNSLIQQLWEENSEYSENLISSFLFVSHRVCNEVINPIWVGIVPFRLFWLRSLKWNEKTKWKPKDKRIKHFYEWFISFSSFFVLTAIAMKSSIQFELELFHSVCFASNQCPLTTSECIAMSALNTSLSLPTSITNHGNNQTNPCSKKKQTNEYEQTQSKQK